MSSRTKLALLVALIALFSPLSIITGFIVGIIAAPLYAGAILIAYPKHTRRHHSPSHPVQ